MSGIAALSGGAHLTGTITFHAYGSWRRRTIARVVVPALVDAAALEPPDPGARAAACRARGAQARSARSLFRSDEQALHGRSGGRQRQSAERPRVPIHVPTQTSSAGGRYSLLIPPKPTHCDRIKIPLFATLQAPEQLFASNR